MLVFFLSATAATKAEGGAGDDGKTPPPTPTDIIVVQTVGEAIHQNGGAQLLSAEITSIRKALSDENDREWTNVQKDFVVKNYEVTSPQRKHLEILQSDTNSKANEDSAPVTDSTPGGAAQTTKANFLPQFLFNPNDIPTLDPGAQLTSYSASGLFLAQDFYLRINAFRTATDSDSKKETVNQETIADAHIQQIKLIDLGPRPQKGDPGTPPISQSVRDSTKTSYWQVIPSDLEKSETLDISLTPLLEDLQPAPGDIIMVVLEYNDQKDKPWYYSYYFRYFRTIDYYRTFGGAAVVSGVGTIYGIQFTSTNLLATVFPVSIAAGYKFYANPSNPFYFGLLGLASFGVASDPTSAGIKFTNLVAGFLIDVNGLAKVGIASTIPNSPSTVSQKFTILFAPGDQLASLFASANK
jgi:hypothetical protein